MTTSSSMISTRVFGFIPVSGLEQDGGVGVPIRQKHPYKLYPDSIFRYLDAK
jgi:hypothetical protein